MTSLSAPALLVLLLVVAPANGLAQRDRTGPAFARVAVDGIELEYEVRGTGEPVVLVHPGMFAEWFAPLLAEPTLSGRYRVLSYHRVGYAASGRVAGSVSIAQQASHLRSVMAHLGIGRAHVVGHSSGGNIALQLALDAPHLVHSLAILEPALPAAPGGPERLLSTGAAMEEVMERFRVGDKASAIDGFMRIVAGPGYRAVLERALPGAFEQAVADADTFFGQELPALRQWSFSREQGSSITQPVLAVIGEQSPQIAAIWGERQRMLLTWLPKAEPFVLAGTTHLLHVQNPGGMAEGLAAFFARHPIKAP